MSALRLRFAVWLALVAVLVWLFVTQLAPRLRIESDITAMLPQTAPDAVVEQALARFAAAAGRRSIFLIEAPDFARARAAGAAFAAALARGDAFEAIEFERHVDWAAIDAQFGPHRGGLLSQQDRELLQREGGEALVEAALRDLYTPTGLIRVRPFAEDPLKLYGNFLLGLTQPGARLALRDGVLTPADGHPGAVLVAAVLRDSPFAIGAQHKAADALASAEHALRTAVPEARVASSGVLRHAIVNSQRARHEIGLFGGLSLAGVFAVFAYCFRSLRPLLLVVCALGVGTLASISAVHGLFGQVHLLSLVFGSSLIGVAVDYAIHFFSDRFREPAGWSGERALRHVGPAIVVGMSTTALGYLAFLVPPFPGLRQMAVFSVAGILTVGISVLLAFPLVAGCRGRPMPRGLHRGFTVLAGIRRPAGRRLGLLAAAAAALLIGGLYQLTFIDDVRALQSTPPALAADEAHIRERIGGGIDTRFFLVEGADAEALLQREEALRQRLDLLVERGGLAGYLALSSSVPSIARQRADRALLAREVYGAQGPLVRLLAQLGFDDAASVRLQAEFEAGAQQPLALQDWLASPLSEPYRALWIGATARGVASVVALNGVSDVAALALAAADVDGVMLIDRVADISTVLEHYRRMALVGLGAVLLAIAVPLALRYGARTALRQLIAPVGGGLLTLAVHGWLGIPANLFTVLGLLLVLGLGVDYGIFLREGAAARPVTLLAISIAAVTTLLSFGMLSVSVTPFIRSLGLAVLLGVASTWLLAIAASAPSYGDTA
ncbi:MAG: MMPL family transporter [Pseudomonadota bacterium]